MLRRSRKSHTLLLFEEFLLLSSDFYGVYFRRKWEGARILLSNLVPRAFPLILLEGREVFEVHVTGRCQGLFPALPKLPRKKPWERGFLLTELFNIYKCTFSYSPILQIPKRGKNRQMEWWETTEDYNPGTSLWRGKIIDIISDEESPPGSDLEEIEAETISQKDASLKVCKCSTYSFMM